jgi:signal transduction histidine kinase
VYLFVLLAASTGLVATELVHSLAFHAPALRATIETGISLATLAGVWVLRAQFNQTRRLRDLLLLGALITLTLVELTSYALPAMLELHASSTIAAAPLIGMLFGAAALLAAALAPTRQVLSERRRWVALAVASGVAGAAVAELGGLLLHPALVDPGGEPARGIIQAAQHPLALGLAVGAAILLVIAAFAFILAAVLRQEAERRSAAARAAAAEERRRLARDLHDGLAQDLAFIAAHGDRIAEDRGSEHPIVVAARRALAISRGAIADLAAEQAPSTEAALQRVASELARRFDISVDVQTESVGISSRDREHIVRIAREAIVNAAWHGHARNVLVTLAPEDHKIVLRVCDDGRGIGGTLVPVRAGFGLRSMRERAAALGGSLTARERPVEGGTELELVVP